MLRSLGAEITCLGILGWALMGCSTDRVVLVLAEEDFYLEWDAPEELYAGHLSASIISESPSGRDHVFKLVMNNETLGVYAPGPAERRLRPFESTSVRALGKRVDLTDEGFEVELWIAEIEIARE